MVIVTDKKLLDLLLDTLPALNWLRASQPVPTDEIPVEHLRALKQLESIGLVYKRNSKTLGLQVERLKKILARATDENASTFLERQIFGSKTTLHQTSPSLSSASADQEIVQN